MRHVRHLAIVALTSALAIAACSSSKPSTKATTTTAKGGASSTSAGSDTSGGSDTTTSGSTDSKICAYTSGLAQAAALATAEGDTKSKAADLQNTFKGMTENAPDAIKSDVATMADAYAKFLDLLAKYDYDSTKLLAAFATDSAAQETLKSLNSTAVQDANKNVATYLAENCGGAAATTSTT